MSVDLVIPVRTCSEINQHRGWRRQHQRTKEQKRVTWLLLNARATTPSLPCRVQMTRLAPRRLDSDNVESSTKWVRDAVAHWLGVDDADERVDWARVKQEKSKQYGVRIEIYSTAPTATYVATAASANAAT